MGCTPAHRSWPVWPSLIATPPAGAAVLDPAFTETPAASSRTSWTGATGLAWAPDGSNRLFVTRKGGAIRIVKNGVLLPTPFATVSPIYTEQRVRPDRHRLRPRLRHQPLRLPLRHGLGQRAADHPLHGAAATSAPTRPTVVAGLPTVGANHDGGGDRHRPRRQALLGHRRPGQRHRRRRRPDLAGRQGRPGQPRRHRPRATTRSSTAPGPTPTTSGRAASATRSPSPSSRPPACSGSTTSATSYEQIFIVRRGDHAGWNDYENNQPRRLHPRRSSSTAPTASTPGPSRPRRQRAVRGGGVVTFTTTAPTASAGARRSPSRRRRRQLQRRLLRRQRPQTPPRFTRGPGRPRRHQRRRHRDHPGPWRLRHRRRLLRGRPASPPAYRGNFFFGDYNSEPHHARGHRSPPPTTSPASTTGPRASAGVDVAVGPDGALYYVGPRQPRASTAPAYNATSQGLVVSPTHLWTAEGQSGDVHGAPRHAPRRPTSRSPPRARAATATAAVDGRRRPDLHAAPTGARPRPSPIAADGISDTADDVATIALQATGLTSETVTVHLRDDNGRAAAGVGGDAGHRRGRDRAPSPWRSRRRLAANVTVAVAPDRRRQRPQRLGGRDPHLHAAPTGRPRRR